MNLSLKAAKVLLHCQPPARHMNSGPTKMGSSKLWPPDEFLCISKAIVAAHTSMPRYSSSEGLWPSITLGEQGQPSGGQASVLHPAVRVSPETAQVMNTAPVIARDLSHCPYCLNLLARKRKCSMEDRDCLKPFFSCFLSTLRQN